jgi:hypothetical protein
MGWIEAFAHFEDMLQRGALQIASRAFDFATDGVDLGRPPWVGLNSRGEAPIRSLHPCVDFISPGCKRLLFQIEPTLLCCIKGNDLVQQNVKVSSGWVKAMKRPDHSGCGSRADQSR